MQTGSASSGRVAQAIDDIDLGALGRALWRRRALILGLTVLAAAAAFAAVNMVTPRYKSEARVLIETRDNIFLRPEAERANERAATVDQEAVTSQVQLILSRALALEVIRKLKLGERPEFDPVLGGASTLQTVLGLFGLAKDPMSQTPEERVLRSYTERLVAFQVEKSRVIAIEFESRDPELAAQVVNTIAESYLVLQQTAKQEQSRAASQWLAGEIETLRKSVAEAEEKVAQYRANTNLIIGTNNTTLSGQQLGDLNAQVAAARAQRADAEAKARIIREALKRGAAAEFSDLINSELLRRLSEQHATLRAQLAEQSSTLLPQHPRIKELRAQIADLERQIRLEAERLARSLENDAKLANARVEALSASLDQLKKQASTSSGQDVELRALEREAKSRRDLLESYLGKFREAQARDSVGASGPEARIISRGIVSTTPSWPKKVPTVLVASLGMFTLAIGFILTGQLMSGAAGGAPAVRERRSTAAASPDRRAEPIPAPLPVLSEPLAPPPPPPRPPSLERASLPPAALKPEPAPGTRTESKTESKIELKTEPVAAALATPVTAPAQAEASLAGKLGRLFQRKAEAPAVPKPDLRRLRSLSRTSAMADTPPTAIAGMGVPIEAVEGLAEALGSAGDSGRRIAVVGARRNMGTTLAAMSLARALAKQGRVVLIDLALASPNLAAIATEPDTPGIGELVAGTASFGQIITRDRLSRVHLITAGKAIADSDSVLSSPRLAITIEALARSYDYVVIDAGALPQIAPAQVAKHVRRAVLVADDIDGPATESARDLLLSAGFPNVSVLASAPQGPHSDAGGRRAAA